MGWDGVWPRHTGHGDAPTLPRGCVLTVAGKRREKYTSQPSRAAATISFLTLSVATGLKESSLFSAAGGNRAHG